MNEACNTPFHHLDLMNYSSEVPLTHLELFRVVCGAEKYSFSINFNYTETPTAICCLNKRKF